MNAAGIDVSSRKSMVAILRPFGEVVKLPFEVCHSAEDLSALAQQLKSIEGETRVVMEHTGRYYESIAKVLHEAGLYVSVVNPLLIKEYGANSLRRVKTDKADAMKIARYALDNWQICETILLWIRFAIISKPSTASFSLPPSSELQAPTILLRFWISLFLESANALTALFAVTARRVVDFAHAFWHVDCVRKQSLNAFSERYRKWCKRHGYFFKQANAEEIYTLAKNAVVLVPKSDVTKVLIQEAANQLTSISRSVETYRTEMERLASMLPEYPVVMQMYGVGKSFGPQLMAEIGDVRRFERKQALVAFAGIDPMPNQSGEKNIRSNKSSKRGSPYLRKTLFNIMSIYLKCAPQEEPIFQFLDRKRLRENPTTFT